MSPERLSASSRLISVMLLRPHPLGTIYTVAGLATMIASLGGEMSFGFNHYVPVLFWKRGEQLALERLAATTKARLTPLIHIVSLPIDLDTGLPTRTLQDHVRSGVERLVDAWGTNDRFLLDPLDVVDEVTAANVDGANQVFAEAAAEGLRFVPVTGLTRAPSAVAAAVGHSTEGICLRITLTEIASPTLATDLLTFVQAHNLSPADIDVVLDLGDVGMWQPQPLALFAQQTVTRLPNVRVWRTLTIISSSFPATMQGITGTSYVERKDWISWTILHASRAQLSRLPSFGDYCIQHPEGVEGFDPRYMLSSAGIRYTLADRWLLIRGGTRKLAPLAAQFPGLAQQLVSHPSFYGGGHCHGCDDALGCASGNGGFGSLEVWRRIGTAHHLTVAADQLAGVAAP